jgi:hypothetical protein
MVAEKGTTWARRDQIAACMTVGDHAMGSGHDDQHDDRHDEHQEPDSSSRTDSPPGGERAGGNGESAAGPVVVTATDPSINSEYAYLTDRVGDPDQAMVIEASTSRIRESHGAVIPRVYAGVVEHVPSPPERSSDSDKPGDEKGRKGSNGADAHSGKDRPKPGQSLKKDQGASGGRGKDRRGRQARAPSMTRILLFSGLVSLACGMIGGAGYSHFFGSSRSDDQKGSGSSKDSGSNRKSDSSDSGSDMGSDTGSETQSGTDSSSRADNGTGLTSAKEWASGEPVRAVNAGIAAAGETPPNPPFARGGKKTGGPPPFSPPYEGGVRGGCGHSHGHRGQTS